VHLSDLIQEDVIRLPLRAADKWQAIEELVDVLVDAHELRLTDRAEVIEAVTTRERSMSTGIGHGIAVPHGAVDRVREIIAALGISREGVPFQAADGKPVHIVVLLVIPKGSFQQHVRTLAGIARLARTEELRERIIGATGVTEVMDAIYEVELAETD
jgi:mannitol/fructose-specific phosphotransferase system IIA component (Ntr-type)